MSTSDDTRTGTDRSDFTGRRKRRIMTAAAEGNFAEWYDRGWARSVFDRRHPAADGARA